MKDLIEELNAVRRTVGDAELPAGAAKVVTLTRSYDAEPGDVWDAITNADRIERWFLPISGDLRLGGNYQLEGNAGGDIVVCDPPQHLQITWDMGGPPGASIVNVRLTADGDDRTTVELEHVAVVPPDMWDQFGPGAVGVGWDLTVLGLAWHLAGIQRPSHEEMEADPKMHAAMTASSESWGKASVAAGVDADVAAAQVAGATAFYVPPPE